jgi:hypothetical protein
MGAFLKAVRKSQVPHPTQPSFTNEKWESSYHKLKEDLEDDDLFEMGKWVNRHLVSVRESLEGNDLIGNLPQKDLLRIVVSDLNRTCCSLSREHLRFSTLADTQLIEATIDRNALGTPFRPDEAASVTVDSARHILARYLATKPSVSCNPIDDSEVLRRWQKVMILAQCYDVYEDIWGKALWREWCVRKENDTLVIQPRNLTFQSNYTVSHYRREALMIQHIGFILNFWKHTLPEETKFRLNNKPSVKITGAGKKREYQIVSNQYDPKRPPITLLSRTFAAEAYYEGLIDTPLPHFPKLSINTCLNAWEILHSICEEHLKKFPTNTGVSSVNRFFEFAPTIKHKKLASLLVSGIPNVNFEIALAIIDFFTFKPRHEIWSNPLVEIEQGVYSIVFTDVLYANLLRNMEVWMKRGGLAVDSKGKEFETECRTSVSKALSESKYFKSWFVSNGQFKIENEEIDILILLPGILLLGEVKCQYFPTKPIEEHRYYATLFEAASQIKRKASVVRENLEAVMGKLGSKASADVKIVPFVLSNQALGTGLHADGVPVLDKIALLVYFQKSEMRHFAKLDENNQAIDAKFTTVLYKSEEEACANIVGYINNPIQVSLLKPFVRAVKFPIFTLEAADRNEFIQRHEVQMPLEKLKFEQNPRSQQSIP